MYQPPCFNSVALHALPADCRCWSIACAPPRGSVDCCSVVPIARLLLVKVLHSEVGQCPVNCSDCFNSLLYAGSGNPKYAVTCTSSLRRWW